VGDQKEIRLSWAKLKGEAYQHRFVAEALDSELLVDKPVTDYPWDFTVRHPSDCKRTFNVQVKGTNCLINSNGCTRYKICCKQGCRNKHTALDPDVIDVAALYVEATNTWYNIPVTTIAGVSVWLYPHKTDSKGQYECWRYDWSVYKT